LPPVTGRRHNAPDMSPESPAGAAYTADRAAALAGVPRSTLYHWARTGIWIPSVSRERVKRWSFADLLALRLIDWLRRDKTEEDIARTPMQQIRRALTSIEGIAEGIESRTVRVRVDRNSGRAVLYVQGQPVIPLGWGFAQGLADEAGFDLVDEWKIHEAIRGPNLVRPRPSLRIIPGKLSGEPHAAGTRIPSRTVWRLRSQGLDEADIIELYPRLTPENVRDAVDLEDELERNLAA
jgi:uncharacterized protein (DUF433 family)